MGWAGQLRVPVVQLRLRGMANTFLFEQLPIDVQGAAGSVVSLSSLLTAAFGADWEGYNRFFIAYEGASFLQTVNAPYALSYWDPSQPSVDEWLLNGTDIGASSVG